MKYYSNNLPGIISTIAVMLLCCNNVLLAQAPKTKPSDNIRQINLLLNKISSIEDSDTKTAFLLIKQVKILCAEQKIDTLTAKAYVEEGFCNFYAGNYKRAAIIFDSSAFYWKKHNLLAYAKSLNDKATALMYNCDYHKSLITFFECLDLDKYVHNKLFMGKVLNNMGNDYESIGDADNAILYEKRSLVYKLAIKDSASLPRSYGNLGNAFDLKEMIDSAIFYERKSYNLYALVHDKEGMAISLGNIGNEFKKKKNIDSAISYLQTAFDMTKNMSNAEIKGNIEDNLAQSYLMKQDLKNTWKYGSMANAYIPQITDNEFLQENYGLLYEYFKKTSNTAKAFYYLQKLNVVNDTLFKQKINIQNQKVAFEYEYKQKKLKDSLVFQSHLAVSEQQATASRNRLYVSLLLLLAAILLAVIWYSRSKLLEKRNIVAQQNFTMQEQKIRELENEKQILASQGVLKGQEDERSRLAKDLHDGLGGLLSGVKHSIIHMKDNIVISSGHVEVFEKSLNMIDTAMKELRRVAQNMMPEALAKFGLEEALKDYCASSSTATFKVIFQSFGSNLKIDNAAEIIVYRIIQELVNNALKHAEATQVMVQLVKGDDWLTLSVEDNGKGFNVNDLKDSAGAGWSNIKSRVDYLKGNIDLKSQAGTGTSVNIEVKIPQT
jgi:two-component system NarL family sensor kinase